MTAPRNANSIKFAVFTAVMAVLTTCLFIVFGEYRSGTTNAYSAVFRDISRLEPGDTVRVAGIKVGAVADISMQPDKTVLVKFDADRDIVLTTGTKAVVRYLNLVGDRYLELVDGPGSTKVMPADSQIPAERTAPALDLDMLLGGLKPVIQGLNPQDVNQLTSSLVEILQGQDATIESLLSRTSAFTNALADKSQVIEQLIDHLNTVVDTLAKEGVNFSAAIDRLEKLVTGLAEDRDPIGEAIESLENGTASVAGLLTEARLPLAGTVDELNRLAPLLDDDREVLSTQISKLPLNYKKLVRLGAYGSWYNFYVCGISFRLSDLQGQTAVFPWVKQEGGRCAEPDA